MIFGVDTTLGFLLATNLCRSGGKIILIAKTGDVALDVKQQLVDLLAKGVKMMALDEGKSPSKKKKANMTGQEFPEIEFKKMKQEIEDRLYAE